MNEANVSTEVWTSENNLNPTEYFKDFHFYEEWDGKKQYQKEIFQRDFGYGLLCYGYKMYVINHERKFIVAEEELSAFDRKKLAPYCQCRWHQTAWYNPARFWICRCCVGCIESDFPQQYVINQTRDYIRKNNL